MSHSIDPAALPAVITRYLAAHRSRDPDTALACCTDDAVTVDDGHTYRGKREIRDWLAGPVAGNYTMTLLAAHRLDDPQDHDPGAGPDDERYVVVHRLAGDFPGRVVDLRFQFTLRAELIAGLTIAP